MKVRYVGPQLYTIGLDDGEIYEVLEIHELTGALLIADRDEPEGCLYDPRKPADNEGYKGGHFEIVEDDEKGSLRKAIYGK